MSQTPSSIALEAAVPGEGEITTADPDLVDWDGPNDACNPINWLSRKRWAHVIIVATLSLIP